MALIFISSRVTINSINTSAYFRDTHTRQGETGDRSIDLLPSFLSDDRTNSDYRPTTARLLDVSMNRSLVLGGCKQSNGTDNGREFPLGGFRRWRPVTNAISSQSWTLTRWSPQNHLGIMFVETNEHCKYLFVRQLFHVYCKVINNSLTFLFVIRPIEEQIVGSFLFYDTIFFPFFFSFEN